MIAVSPMSVTETFTETVRAFNMAEKYRTPVIILSDEVVGHMREKLVIPAPGELEVYDRIRPEADDENYLAYRVEEGDIVPKMAAFGSGHRYHITGLFHDETGFPSNSTANAEIMLDRMMNKVAHNLADIESYDEFMTEDAEHLIISYGSTARAAKAAVMTLRAEGIKVGLFRPITIWPYPAERTIELAKQVKSVTVAEMNLGQLKLEVERVVKGEAPVQLSGKANGEVLTPGEIVAKVKEAL